MEKSFLLICDIYSLPATIGQGATTWTDISPATGVSHQGQSQLHCRFVLPSDLALFSIIPKDHTGIG